MGMLVMLSRGLYSVECGKEVVLKYRLCVFQSYQYALKVKKSMVFVFVCGSG